MVFLLVIFFPIKDEKKSWKIQLRKIKRFSTKFELSNTELPLSKIKKYRPLVMRKVKNSIEGLSLALSFFSFKMYMLKFIVIKKFFK